MCVHMPEDAQSQHQVSSLSSLSTCVSPWIWRSLVLLGCQATKVWGTCSPCFFSADVRGGYYCVAYLWWVPGIWSQVLMINSQALYWLSQLPGPYIFIYTERSLLYIDALYIWNFGYYILIGLDFYLAICVISFPSKVYTISFPVIFIWLLFCGIFLLLF